MQDQKITKPDVVLELSEEQIQTIAPLVNKRKALNGGLILGSVGLSGNTVALSFIPQKIGEQISNLAYREMGENDGQK